ncbi:MULTISPECIES: tripartite tricarboxylate transporter substrate binding protein [unclassified Pigmentiphaga]|uniref:Bug family tripartite tricarboxylate transporter substrate binding protein n=1 Tax=unclassified Pigmentiphaga TaxID=2626614 RepID=UPI0010525B37|nr:tripartite tricarboxylate transporter substrate binding protein [Pigmentiphaga sp. D-2]
MNHNRRALLAALPALAWGMPGGARAQGNAYPTRQMRFVVPFTAGGGNDVLARDIAQPLADILGQPIVVDNKPGAGGNIGADLVAKAAPDGHTLLLATNTLTINPFVLRSIPFDVARDLAPVMRIANQPIVIVVNNALPVKNMRELVAYADEHPDRLNYASPGSGTPHHMAAELFKQVSGIRMVHVPYKGASQALTDLIAGQVQIMFASIISALPFIQSGRVRVIATAESRRLSLLKDVPTVQESGFPTYSATIWGGVMTTAGTPPAVIDKLAASIRRALDKPGVRSGLVASGFEVLPEGPTEFGATVRSDLVQWQAVAQKIGLVPE